AGGVGRGLRQLDPGPGQDRSPLRSGRGAGSLVSEDERLLAFALECCDAADAIALRWFRAGLDAERKPDGSYVTPADTEIERELRQRIQRAHPGSGVLGEELAQEPGDGESRWIIDP